MALELPDRPCADKARGSLKPLRFLRWCASGMMLLLTVACAGPVDREEGAERESAPPPRLAESASQIEAAKLAGNDYWARGNEPGWMLEIGPQLIVWTTDYGETRYEVATPAPEVDQPARSSVFRAELEGVPLIFTIVGETCHDDMSGEEFETRFRIDHGERTYRGCGQALH